MPTFFEFLTSISGSGANNPYRSLPIYRLSDTYENRTYQNILEQNFGRTSDGVGTTVACISENEVLSFGQRAFLLKLAIFTSNEDCYKFLDYIYSCIVTQRPGFYWDVLKAIKTINDYCNNTKILNSTDYFYYQVIDCGKLLFKNTGNAQKDLLPPGAVSAAIKTLIKESIEFLSAQGRCKDPENYKQTQIALAKTLDQVTPNPLWRMYCKEVTVWQMHSANSRELNMAWEERKKQREEKIARGEAIYLVLNNTDDGIFQVRLTVNKEVDDTIDRISLQMMQADLHRYNEELALIREANAAKKPNVSVTKKPTP